MTHKYGQIPDSELENQNLDRDVSPMVMTRGGLAKTSGGSWLNIKVATSGSPVVALGSTEMKEKWITGNLADADTGGGIFGIANPESGDIIITAVFIDITTASTGAGTADIGIANDGTTANDILFSGLNLNSVEVSDTLASQGSGSYSSAKATSGQYITCSTASGSASGLAGKYYISYIIA